MDIGKAFTFLTEDEEWLQKLGIGSLIAFAGSIIPFIPLLLLTGYELEITRRYVHGDKPLLPAWDDLGKYFMDGLYVAIARLVYASPLLLLFCVFFGVLTVPALLEADGEVMAVIFSSSAFVTICLGFLLAIALIFLTPAINIQYIRTGEFGSLFRVGEVIAIARDNMGSIVLMVIAVLAGWIIISIISSILAITICGAFIATWVGMAWIRMVSGHLVGQIAAKMDGGIKEAVYAG